MNHEPISPPLNLDEISMNIFYFTFWFYEIKIFHKQITPIYEISKTHVYFFQGL